MFRKRKLLFSSKYVYEIKPKSQEKKKLLRRVRFKGIAKEIIEKVFSDLPSLLQRINNKCFLQFLTGIYEADGAISYRPSGKSRYLEVEIKFAKNEGIFTKLIAQRLKQLYISEVKVTFDKKYNVWRLRVYKELDVTKFFELVNPLIRNPKNFNSFKETNARNPEILCKLFRETKEKWKKLSNFSDLF